MRVLHDLTPRSKHYAPRRLTLASQKSLNWPCRCRHKRCEARQSKPKHPSAYVRATKCVKCGRANTLRVDWYRIRKEWSVKPCRCNGYSFPHFKGRGFCWHNPAADHEERRMWA